MVRSYPPNPAEVFQWFREWITQERGLEIRDEDIEEPDKAQRTLQDIDYLIRPLRLAIEVSSVWRSEAAGKEDRDWAKITDEVAARLRGHAPGPCHVYTELRIPASLSAEQFSRDLLEVLRHQETALREAGTSARGLYLEVSGVKCSISMMPLKGNDVSFGRLVDSTRDLTEYQAFIKRVLQKKSPKLRRYKIDGHETWLVIYNTMWPVFSPAQVKEFASKELTYEHHHIDHVAFVGPDSWINVIR